jgi:hypothetical protein
MPPTLKATRPLTSTFSYVLGGYDKLIKSFALRFLKANPPKADRASRLRIARSVAVLVSLYMGIGLSTEVDAGIEHTFTSKDYIRSLLSKEEALCLIKLYGKESAFRIDAIGNLDSPTKSYTYGIPQLKNPLIRDMSEYNQIDYGIKYIEHRYVDACDAYAHWVKKGWH